jgi:hypothetical protein
MSKSGAPTSEFNKYGGYGKVSAMYEKSGGAYRRGDQKTSTLKKASGGISALRR